MRSYVLQGIDKYHNHRLICLIEAESLADAARKLGGEVLEVGVVGENSKFNLSFDRGQECATFVPGNCTDEVLAQAAAAGEPRATQRLVAYYRYGTDNIYRGYVLGTAPEVR